MSAIPTLIEEEPELGDGSNVASHSQSIYMSTIKEEPGADLLMEAESIRVESADNGTLGTDELVKQEAREEVDNFVFIKLEPGSCSRFLPEMTRGDNVQVKEERMVNVKLEEFGSSVDSPTLSVDPPCGPVIKIESCQVCTQTDLSSVVDVKQVSSKSVSSSSYTSIGGMSRCCSIELFKEEQERIQGNRDEEQLFSCHTCSKNFKWKKSLIVHMRQHTGERPYVCNLCKSRFRRAGQLKEHKRTHTGEKPFVCDVCESRFSQASTLKRHKRTHSGEKPFLCDLCESRFSQVDHLKLHKRIHTGEKPYLCDVCESRFSRAGTLKTHKRIHTGEKPYMCDICEFRFSRARDWKRHKRIHTEEKPYACDICESRFREAGTLKNHKRTHTGEKPFLCDICESRFTRAGTLKKHKRIHTREKP